MKTYLLILLSLLAATPAVADTSSFEDILVTGTVTFTNPLPISMGGTGATSFSTNGLIVAAGPTNFSYLTPSANKIVATDSGSVPALTATLPSAVQANITAVSSASNLLVHSISSGVAGLGNAGDFSGQHFVPTTDNGVGFQVGAQTFRFRFGYFGQNGLVIGGDGSSSNGATITATGTAPNETLVLRGHGTAGVDVGTVTAGTWNGTTIGAGFLPLATTGAFGVVKPDGTTITISSGVIHAAAGGGGSVTNVATGTGLTGGPITTTGTVSLQVPVTVSNGGTGLTNIASTQIMIGNGTGAVTVTGNLTADTSGNVSSGGVVTFTNASGGVAGQVIGGVPPVGIVGYTSGVGLNSGSAISLTTNTPVNIVSHTFPAGHFLIWGNGWYSPGSGTTFSFCVSGISTSSASLPGVDSASENQNAAPFCATGIAGTLPILAKSFSFNTPTTVYLVSASVFSGGTMSAFGGMSWQQLQ